MASTENVVVAYGGVHQAYQIALACHEAQCLERFYCSWLVGPSKWGGILNKLTSGRLAGWSMPGLPVEKVTERPWPYLRKRITDRLAPSTANNWLPAHENFDRWVAKRLELDRPKVFVGTETCDLWSLESAKKAGAVTVHDCPQIHPTSLAALMEEASDRAGFHLPAPTNRSRMEDRKLAEYALADHLMVYSDFHRHTFESQGFQPQRLFQCPLWVDASFWTPLVESISRPSDHPLRVLFVGSLTLRKGLPFLIRAINRLGKAVTLTLAGPAGPEAAQMLAESRKEPMILGPLSKPKLREVCQTHDLLVLPSVADSFGFVALEAMACGLPVLLSENCGAPVPAGWRVPAMDVEALVQKIGEFASAPERLGPLRLIARQFALRFTPQQYRSTVAPWLRSLRLGATPLVEGLTGTSSGQADISIPK